MIRISFDIEEIREDDKVSFVVLVNIHTPNGMSWRMQLSKPLFSIVARLAGFDGVYYISDDPYLFAVNEIRERIDVLDVCPFCEFSTQQHDPGCIYNDIDALLSRFVFFDDNE